MKKIILTIFPIIVLFLLCHEMALAQGYARGADQGNSPKDAKITGIIIDEGSNQAVPFASVALYHAKDSTLLTGVLSKDDGSFGIDKLPYGKFYAIVTFVGYKPHKVDNILLTPNKKIAALGTIKVNISTTEINEVKVVGTVPPVKYQIDKKVVNIAQNLTASGGTLAEALQNAPSVQSDVEGNVTVRGSSNFTVLVDGRPSPIAGSDALQQIPANLVENVEIITNPSAKYEAEGSVGIINIVMKKQKVRGSSGVINMTAGTGNKYSSNISLNYKLSKFNFTLGGDFTDMKSNVTNYTTNADTLSSHIIKNRTINGTGSFKRQGRGISAGIDYNINDNNSLTLTGSLGKRNMDRPSASQDHDMSTNNLIASPITDVFYTKNSSSKVERNYSTLNLDYELKLDNKGQKLSASAYFSTGPNNNVNESKQDTTNANWVSLGKRPSGQQTEQNSNGTEVRTKVDYALQIGTSGKLEAGYQGKYSNNDGTYSLKNYIKGTLDNDTLVEDITKKDQFNFKDQIQAGYFTLSNSMPLFDYLIGLRLEYEDRVFKQEIQNKEYKLNRIDPFPTIHLTKQLPWDLQLQTSYTRRINRPHQSNINPLPIHTDLNTIQQGNAELLPEFANAYELNLEKKLKGSSFVSVEGFLRQTSHLIQPFSTFDTLTQITTNTFKNIDSDRSLGAELMVYLEPFKWFNINTSLNIFNYHLFGVAIPSVASSTNTWNIHVSPSFHLDKKTSIQISYIYNAATITAQGTRSGNYSSSLAIRRTVLKNKGSLTLQCRDFLGSANYISTTEIAHQYQYNRSNRESQVVLLTFSYHINNYKAKQSTRQNMDDSNNNELDMEHQVF